MGWWCRKLNSSLLSGGKHRLRKWNIYVKHTKTNCKGEPHGLKVIISSRALNLPRNCQSPPSLTPLMCGYDNNHMSVRLLSAQSKQAAINPSEGMQYLSSLNTADCPQNVMHEPFHLLPLTEKYYGRSLCRHFLEVSAPPLAYKVTH